MGKVGGGGEGSPLLRVVPYLITYETLFTVFPPWHLQKNCCSPTWANRVGITLQVGFMIYEGTRARKRAFPPSPFPLSITHTLPFPLTLSSSSRSRSGHVQDRVCLCPGQGLSLSRTGFVFVQDRVCLCPDPLIGLGYKRGRELSFWMQS